MGTRRHRTVTDVDHERARTVMGALVLAVADGDVEVPDLSVYDRATGVA